MNEMHISFMWLSIILVVAIVLVILERATFIREVFISFLLFLPNVDLLLEEVNYELHLLAEVVSRKAIHSHGCG